LQLIQAGAKNEDRESPNCFSMLDSCECVRDGFVSELLDANINSTTNH